MAHAHRRPVGIMQDFEPYAVMARKHTPWYDERFRQYGYNKVAMLWRRDEQLGACCSDPCCARSHQVPLAALRWRACQLEGVLSLRHMHGLLMLAGGPCEELCGVGRPPGGAPAGVHSARPPFALGSVQLSLPAAVAG